MARHILPFLIALTLLCGLVMGIALFVAPSGTGEVFAAAVDIPASVDVQMIDTRTRLNVAFDMPSELLVRNIVFSPDGRRAVLMRRTTTGAVGNGGRYISVLDLESGAIHTLEEGFTVPFGQPPVWSSDSRRFTLQSNTPSRFQQGTTGLHIVEAESLRVTAVTEALNVNTLRWSPDNRYLAGIIDDQLQIFTADGTRLHQFEGFDPLRSSVPLWSPDSTHLALAVSTARPDSTQATVIVAVGSGDWRPVDAGTVAHPVEWSPDGEWLSLIEIDRSPGLESRPLRVFTLHLPGDALYTVNEDAIFAGALVHPRWSPDGETLVLSSTDISHGGASLLATVAPDGAVVDHIPLSAAWARDFAAWSPDGAQIVTTINEALTLYAAEGLESRYQDRGVIRHAWTGDQLVYIRRQRFNGGLDVSSRLYLVDPVKGHLDPLTAPADYVVAFSVWR